MKNLLLLLCVLVFGGCNGNGSALIDNEKSNCRLAVENYMKGQAGMAMVLSAAFGDAEKVDVDGIKVELNNYQKHISITALDSMEFYKQMAIDARERRIAGAKLQADNFRSEVEKDFARCLEHRAACQKIVDENPEGSYLATLHQESMDNYPATMEEYIAKDTLKSYSRYREAEQLRKKYEDILLVDLDHYTAQYPQIEYYKSLPQDKVLRWIVIADYKLMIPGRADKECVEYYYFNEDLSEIMGEFDFRDAKKLPNNKSTAQ